MALAHELILAHVVVTIGHRLNRTACKDAATELEKMGESDKNLTLLIK